MSLSIQDVFDAEFYRTANPDTASFNDEQALEHFQKFGLNEGRQFSSLIDLNFYRSNNPDLAGFNNSQLLNHLRNFGIAEGRSFSPIIDLDYYRSNSSDLQSFNNEQLFEHLKNYGVFESRDFSVLFSPSQYQGFNFDLNNLNYYQLLNHFVSNGINEGRTFSLSFNFGYYRSNNPDLATFSNSQLLQHFKTNGLDEGRKSSPFFDAGYYKANNPDLATLTGIELVEHFFQNGRFEGRSATSDLAGDSLTNPRNLTTSPNYIAIQEHVGADDPADYYRFELNESSLVDLSIVSLSRSIGGQVLDSSGQVVGNPISTATSDADPSGTYFADYYDVLSPGTYYLGIQPLSGNTVYGFELNTRPDPGFDPGISDFPIGYYYALQYYSPLPITQYGITV